MELEEMKSLWNEMSAKVEKQQVLTDKLIMEMTRNQYRNRFSKVISLEGAGTIVCFFIGVFLIANFWKLDTWYLQMFGVFAIGYFFIMPFLIMRSLFKIRGLHISNENYSDNIRRYAVANKRVMSLQRVAIVVNFLLFLAIIPLSDKVLNDNDMFAGAYEVRDAWILGITLVVATVVMILISRWGFRSYKKVTASAERLLKDLET